MTKRYAIMPQLHDPSSPLSRSRSFPHLPAVKYPGDHSVALSSLPREAYAPAGGGNNENGCILTTHTLIVNPVNVADRAGASPASGDHPLIRSFASLQPPSHLHPNVLRTSSFETCTLYQNPLPFFSLSLSLLLYRNLRFSLSISHPTSSPSALPRRARAYARMRTVTSTMRIIHAISRIYRVLRNIRRIL